MSLIEIREEGELEGEGERDGEFDRGKGRGRNTLMWQFFTRT